MLRLRRITLSVVVAGVLIALSVAGPAAARNKSSAHAAIVGGAPAAPGAWPWLAFIADDQGTQTATCTGTVVAPNIVLTAAHCAENISTGALDPPSGFTVVTGSLDWTDPNTRQASTVTNVITHAASVTTSVTGGINVIGDAALLVLATPTTAPPIPLATSADVALMQGGTGGAIAGWGLTDPNATTTPTIVQTAPTVIQDAAYCLSRNPYFSALAQLCTVDAPYYTTSICQGDSGGPLLAQRSDSTWVQVGISSTTIHCDPTRPDTFTRVDYIYAWAENWIASQTPAPTPTTVAPTPVTPPTQATPPQPQTGKYIGQSGQQNGRLNLTLTTAGITHFDLQWNYHCPHGRRGPYIETPTWRNNPIALNSSNGTWGFTTHYSDTAHARYIITGTFPTPTTASGTLDITGPQGKCTTRLVHWTATLPTA